MNLVDSGESFGPHQHSRPYSSPTYCEPSQKVKHISGVRLSFPSYQKPKKYISKLLRACQSSKRFHRTYHTGIWSNTQSPCVLIFAIPNRLIPASYVGVFSFSFVNLRLNGSGRGGRCGNGGSGSRTARRSDERLR